MDTQRTAVVGLGLAAVGRPAYITPARDRDLGTSRSVEELEADGTPLFGVVQSTWNLLEPSAGAALAEAADAGLRVVVKEAVANGRLTSAEADPASGVTEAARLAGELGVGVDQVAIAAALAQPWSSVVLSGAVLPGQVRSNLAASELDLPAHALEELLTCAEEPEAYWRTRSARAWS